MMMMIAMTGRVKWASDNDDSNNSKGQTREWWWWQQWQEGSNERVMMMMIAMTGRVKRERGREGCLTFSTVLTCHSLNLVHKSWRCEGDSRGLRAARRHRATISSHRLAAACWVALAELLLPRLMCILLLLLVEAFVTNHQIKICRGERRHEMRPSLHVRLEQLKTVWNTTQTGLHVHAGQHSPQMEGTAELSTAHRNQDRQQSFMAGPWQTAANSHLSTLHGRTLTYSNQLSPVHTSWPRTHSSRHLLSTLHDLRTCSNQLSSVHTAWPRTDSNQPVHTAWPRTDSNPPSPVHTAWPRTDSNQLSLVHTVWPRTDSNQLSPVHTVWPRTDSNQLSPVHTAWPRTDNNQPSPVHIVWPRSDNNQPLPVHTAWLHQWGSPAEEWSCCLYDGTSLERWTASSTFPLAHAHVKDAEDSAIRLLLVVHWLTSSWRHWEQTRRLLMKDRLESVCRLRPVNHSGYIRVMK